MMNFQRMNSERLIPFRGNFDIDAPNENSSERKLRRLMGTTEGEIDTETGNDSDEEAFNAYGPSGEGETEQVSALSGETVAGETGRNSKERS